MKLNIIITLFIFGIVFPKYIFSYEDNKINQQTNLISSTEASSLALKYTCLDSSKSYTAIESCELVDMDVNNLNAPAQILKQIDNLKAWKISINSILLDYDITDEQGVPIVSEDEILRDFDIYIDAINGNLLCVISQLKNTMLFSEDIWIDVGIAEYNNENNMKISISNPYEECPLFYALSRKSVINPLSAKEIEAFSVQFKWVGSDKKSNLYPTDLKTMWFIVSKYYNLREADEITSPGKMEEHKSVSYRVVNLLSNDPIITVTGSMPPKVIE